MKHSHAVRVLVAALALAVFAGRSAAQLAGPPPPPPFAPAVPTMYDDAETATWHVPLAVAKVSPSFLTSSYFYARKVRPIFRTYPVYHPDREPAGYLKALEAAEPEIVWDGAGRRPKLETEADWVRAGEVVYDAPIAPRPLAKARHFRDRDFLKRVGVPVAADGTLPGLHYVVRTRGQPELAIFSCATCHTRVLPGGATVKATQGNLPLARIEAHELRAGDSGGEADVRKAASEYHGTPWLPDGPNGRLSDLTVEQFARAKEACPPGVYPNHNGSVFTPAHTAELRGLRGRRYLDCTGHMRHRGPADLMRFADFHQWASAYAGFGEFRPQTVPDPESQERYSDEQAYALALYLYSLAAPANPSPPTTVEEKARVARGREVFADPKNRCATCHDPAQGYTNNKLTPVDGFAVPPGHPERAHVMPRSVHTDPAFALQTRKGTGFYKVPTLLGVWYRGPFEHNGSVATLEDWFDPARTRDDYVPTGWKGPPGTTTRAVRGHEFGLDLSGDDRAALLAFLRTL
jgi:cytochrome c peroxidase